MAILQTSSPTDNGLLRKDDEAWVRGILSLIPKSIYEEIPSSSNLIDKSSKELRKQVKRNKTERSTQASKNRRRSTKGSEDNPDSRRAALQTKLHEKILAKRAERKADEESYIESRTTKKRKRDEQSKATSRERKISSSNKGGGTDNTDEIKKDFIGVMPSEGKKRKRTEAEKDDNMAAIETTRVDGFNDENRVKKVKRRKLRGGKLLELQKRLVEANKENSVDTDQNNSAERRDGECDSVSRGSRSREMEKALERAQGATVKDDVKKLKKSIRREKRRAEKSKEEWAKRATAQEMEQKARQEKKMRNLEERRSARKSAVKNQGSTTKKK